MGNQSRDEVERKSGIRKVLLIVSLILLLGAAGFFGYHYYREWKVQKQQQNYDDLRDRAFVTSTVTPSPTKPSVTEAPVTATPTPTHTPTEEEMLFAAIRDKYEEYLTIHPDFNILHAENEDIFAYISVPNTIVDYPILAHEIEDYYLDHNLDHSTGYPGCLYIQNCNSKSLDDPFTIVYGHNMNNGTMFGSLHKYDDPDFLAENRYFFVYQERRVMVYEIVVVSYITTEHLLSDDYVKVDGKWKFDKFDGYETARMIKRVRDGNDARSYIASPEPTDDDTLMVLSTCGEGKRFIVVGKRVLDIPTDRGIPMK
ncbi:MAG: class B sortase [Lachnospiraceae bacterium]|nr:class B sortase [Lachnospiraceae bacterium]